MPAPCNCNTQRVLIVEDQADLADTLATYLNLVGRFQTTVARDGEAGVAAALRDHPDAVVCDLGLPKKSGLAVARELSQLPDRPLLIAVTAYSDEATRVMARRAGFDHFLVKPAYPEDIQGLLLAHASDPVSSPEVGSVA